MMRWLPMLFLLIMLVTPVDSLILYGQIINENEPAGDIAVTARWMDDAGRERITVARTLGLSDAQQLGQPYIPGYYVLENLNPRAGTDIALEIEGAKEYVLVKQAAGVDAILVKPIVVHTRTGVSGVYETVKEVIGIKQEKDAYYVQRKNYGSTRNTTSDPGQGEPFTSVITQEAPKPIKNASVQDIAKSVPNGNISTPVPEGAKSPINNITLEYREKSSPPDLSVFLRYFALAVFLIVIVILATALRRYVFPVIVLRISQISLDPTVINTRRFFEMRVEGLYKPAVIIDKDSSVSQAAAAIAAGQAERVYIADKGRYLGTLACIDIVRRGLDPRGKALDISEYDNDSIYPRASLSDALFILCTGRAGALRVESNAILSGEISAPGMLSPFKGYSRYFRQGPDSGLSTVRDIMDRRIPKIDSRASVDSARQKMVEQDYGILLVYDGENLVGIFTARDYIESVHKYQEEAGRQIVTQCMTASVVGMDPDLNIFEANELLQEKGFRSYPVISKGVVLGILDEKKLCEEIYRYLSGRI